MQIFGNKQQQVQVSAEKLTLFSAQTYGWMTLGLIVTAITSVAFAAVPSLQSFYANNTDLVLITFLVQIGIVFGISFLAQRMPWYVVAGLFLFYSASVGFTLTSIFSIYEFGSIAVVFAVTAGTFAVMSLIGMTTKINLMRWGGLLLMGLVGIIIGSIVNIFLQSEAIYWFLTYFGVFLFMVMIAYDAQRVKAYAAQAEMTGNGMQLSLLAALSLYLDFINLFIRLLAILGERK